MALKWRDIDGVTQYIPVPGGVVLLREIATEAENGMALAATMVFVPCSQEDIAGWEGSWRCED